MALVSSQPIRTPIPHEPSEYLEFRRLSWKQLRQARKVAEAEGREQIKTFGPEFIKAMQGATDQAALAQARDLLKEQQWDASQFDRETLLRLGVIGWSYEQPLDEDSIDQLDEPTAAWAAETILALSRPHTEDQEKNADGRSTGSSTGTPAATPTSTTSG